MGKRITRKEYDDVKVELELKNPFAPVTAESIKEVAKEVGISPTSVKRIVQSKSYDDFKAIVAKAHGKTTTKRGGEPAKKIGRVKRAIKRVRGNK